MVPCDGTGGEFVRCRSDERQRFHKAYSFCGRQRIKQRSLRSFGCQTGTAKRPSACRRDRNRVGARILFGSVPRQKSAIQHAPNHIRKRRPIDTRRFHEHCLTGLVLLIERSKHKILLPRQILVARFSGKQISEELIAPAKQVRWRARELTAPVRFALSRRGH